MALIEKEYEIYSVTFPNGKKYIGVTTTGIEKRINDHISASKTKDYKFYRALKKYENETIVVDSIGTCENKEQAIILEKAFIELFDSKKNGYNSTIGGDGVKHPEVTDEWRRNVSIAQKKRFENPIEREKASLAFKKWVAENPEKHAAIEKERKDITTSKEHRDKMSSIMTDYYKEHPEKIEKQRNTLNLNYSESYDIQKKISRSLGGKTIEVFKDGVKVDEYPSIMEASRKLGVSCGNVASVLSGKRNHTYGYVFGRKDE